MMNKQILLDIISIYEENVLKEADEFSVKDYNSFEQEIWNLKKKYNLSENESPFLSLPEPAQEADYFMMNASGEGLGEPELEDKIKYLEMMKISYEKLKKKLN